MIHYLLNRLKRHMHQYQKSKCSSKSPFVDAMGIYIWCVTPAITHALAVTITAIAGKCHTAAQQQSIPPYATVDVCPGAVVVSAINALKLHTIIECPIDWARTPHIHRTRTPRIPSLGFCASEKIKSCELICYSRKN